MPFLPPNQQHQSTEGKHISVYCISLMKLSHTLKIASFVTEKKSGKPEPGECLPPDYLLPGCKDRPLVPLHPIHKELKVPNFM